MKSLLINIPLGHMANDWAPATLWILAPAIALSLDLSPSEVGLLISIIYLGSSIGYLPAGIFADRIKHQGRLLAITFWWVAVGFFLASYATDFWSLAIILALAGMGDAAWHPVATGVLVKQMPGRRGMVLGIHAMGGTMAEVGAPLVTGFLLSYFDWRQSLQFSIIPAVIMGLVFIVFAKRIPKSEAKAVSKFELSEITKHWLKPKGLALIAMVSSYNMALMALMSMAALLLQSKLHFTAATAGIIFASSMLIGTLLQPIMGRYSDTLGRHNVFISGSLIAILCSIIATLTQQPFIIIAALIINMGALLSIRSGVLATAVDYLSSRAATTLGFVFMLLDGVGAIGAVLAGYVSEVDLQYIFPLAGTLSAISVIIAIVLYKQDHIQSKDEVNST